MILRPGVCYYLRRKPVGVLTTCHRQHLPILVELPRINEWAFTVGRDAPVMYRTVRLRFAEIAAKAGLENVRLHDLRRTLMTQAAAAGIGTHVLRDLLGHKTTAMADRYVRAVGNPVRDATGASGCSHGSDNGRQDWRGCALARPSWMTIQEVWLAVTGISAYR